MAVPKWSGLREGVGSTQEVLLSGHWMSRHLKLGRGVLKTNKTLLKTLWLLNLKVKEKVLVTQLCTTFCDPMDYNPPGSSIHGILQARMLEWVAISSCGGSLAPHERLPEILVVPREKTPTGAAARGNP